jgi:hypothetical protein
MEGKSFGGIPYDVMRERRVQAVKAGSAAREHDSPGH